MAKKKRRYRKRHLRPVFRLALFMLAAAGVLMLFLHACTSEKISEKNDIGETSPAAETVQTPEIGKKTDNTANESGGFYYRFLNEAEQKAYNAVLASAEQFAGDTDITDPLDYDSVCNVLIAAEYDHPEYYWLHGPAVSSMNAFGNVTRVSFDLKGDEKETAERIMEKARSVLSETNAETDYEKVRYIYEWIIDHTIYDASDSDRKQTVLSVLDEGTSVCAGYAKTFKLLCDLAGIRCAVVSGTADDGNQTDGSHMWNLVCLDDRCYWADPTWGDPTGMTGDNKTLDYLCISDRFINIGHTAETVLSQAENGNLAVSYPVCSDDSYDYYVQNGSFFETYDAAAAEAYISGRAAEGETRFEMKFGSQDELNRAISGLIENSRIFEIVNRSGKGYYSSLEYSPGSIGSLLITVR